MKYDAFISYRHGELDGLVADKLHKMLETYRIPRVIARRIGKTRLTRVFRDREELPTSSNLSGSINDALENSAFLLLICSRRTCQSKWVMREIELFGKLRGKDRIITLLIDGEPDESFPPDLREREVGGQTIFVEPLAADIRAATPAGSIKLLKEEKLRLLAPILGCAFDDLRRRHRRRQIQRAATGIGAAFAFVLSFGSFSTWQYLQIDRQMQLKLENQSYVLTEYAQRELADGDPDTAMLLSLEALPRGDDRPFVPEAQRALADALAVYDASDGYKAHKSLALPAAPGALALSPDGATTAVVCPFELTLIDNESGAVLATLPAARSALAGVVFLDDSTVLFAGESGLTAYDARGGGLLWMGQPATLVAVSGDRSTIAAMHKEDDFAVLYNASDGLEIARIHMGKTMRVPVDDSFVNPRDTLFALDHAGERLAVSFSDGSLVLFGADAVSKEELYPPSAAVWFSGGFFGDTLAYAAVEKQPYASAFAVYDASKGKELARYQSDTSRFLPQVGKDGIFVAFDDQIMVVNARTGAVAHCTSAGGRIESFAGGTDAFLICESSGAYRLVSAADGVRVFSSGYPCHFSAVAGRYALTGSLDSEAVRILRHSDGAGEVILAYAPAERFSEVKAAPALDRVAFYDYRGLRLCTMTAQTIAQVEFPDPLSVLDTQYDRASGNIAVLYESAFRLYSGKDASLLLEREGKPDAPSVLYTPFGISVLSEDGTVTLYDLENGAAVRSADAGVDAQSALPLGDSVMTVREGRVFLDGRDIGAGKPIGAARTREDSYAFAVADGVGGKVFTLERGLLAERFSFATRGRTEAFFAQGIVFISPQHGAASAYGIHGELIRAFEENAYLAEVESVGGYVAANYVSAASERYSLLLTPDTLQTASRIAGYLGTMEDNRLLLDSGSGELRALELRDMRQLTDLALERLGGRALTPEEQIYFRAG